MQVLTLQVVIVFASWPPNVADHFGVEFAEKMQKFCGGRFASIKTDIMTKLAGAMNIKATEICSEFIAKMEDVFGTGCDTLDFSDADSTWKSKLNSWTLDVDSMRKLTAFADECKSEIFKQELTWITALHVCLNAFLALQFAWSKKNAENADEARDAKSISKELVLLVKNVRMQRRLFGSTAGYDMQSLFKGVDGITVLKDRFKPDAVSMCIAEGIDTLLASVSVQWTADISELSAAICDWCPDYKAAGGGLLAAPAIVRAMVSNSAYPSIVPACTKLDEMRNLAKKFLTDGTGCLPVVGDEVLSAAKTAVQCGVSCVTVTYGLFLVLHELPKIVNITIRGQEIDAYKASAVAKEVKLPKDLLEKLDELKASSPSSAAAAAGSAQQ